LADSSFAGRWETNRSKEPLSARIKEAVAPQGDLKKKLNETDRALASQIVKLDRSIAKMNEKEKNLFSRTSSAFQRHDTVLANAYANELSEQRKAIKLVTSAKLSLESVQARLKTITDIGDLANLLSPVGQVVGSVRRALVTVMPSANETMGEISSGLEGLVREIGGISGTTGFIFETTSEDAEKILAEASVVAESKMSQNLPDLPDVSATDTAATDTSI
jgi:division protein CdvB (Snf7/Vps24/ESCRT-III family)